MSDLINSNVAIQLKKARSEKGWSLGVTSQHCSVSKAMLGQIERGESSPTIAKLWNIATGFGLPLSYFLNMGDESGESLIFSEGQKVYIENVFEYDPATGIEVFTLNYAVGHEQYSEAHQVGVIEHIMVLEGAMEYFIEGQWHALKSGDKAKFSAAQLHGYRNVGSGLLTFSNIIAYPHA